ncbi:MAG: hypothetical protein DCF22_17965 [Leptolyngbya sp.]|nr:MAG: hypothetical protein DCF22_17965 [Leptolyngbya sp.]
MKLNRAPLILLIAAVLLGSVVYLQEQTAPPPVQSQAQLLFGFQEADVRSLSLKTSGQNLSFVKNDAPSPATWKMTVPNQAPANDASVAYLLNAIASAKSVQPLTVPTAKQAEFGFDAPLAIVNLTLKDGKTHRLILGKPDFNRTSLYAQIDPQSGADLKIFLVSLDFENAVNRPLSEWQLATVPTPKASTPNTAKP